jgi:CheY-like chemotaxis protein
MAIAVVGFMGFIILRAQPMCHELRRSKSALSAFGVPAGCVISPGAARIPASRTPPDALNDPADAALARPPTWRRSCLQNGRCTPEATRGDDRMGCRPKILLVEDDRLIRMGLALVLGREGYELDMAVCAADAYALLGRNHYELILADIGLPDESGLEVLHAAKRTHPSTKVVLVTGSQGSLTPEQAAVEGAEWLLLKPFALAELLETVRRFTAPEVDVNLRRPDRRLDKGPEPAV